MDSRSKRVEHTTFPWPFWLLRYIASDDQGALNDAIWSVGGSPAYGGVSYEEASAVYELLEQYLGPGMAPEEAYEAVRQHVTDKPDRLDALELFRIRDRIATAPEDFTTNDVAQGMALAKRLGHIGVWAYFLTLQAQLDYGKGNIPVARQLTLEALPVFVHAALEDGAYAQRVVSTVQNAISYCALDGDFDTARQLLGQMGSLLADEARRQLHALLGDKPAFSPDLSQVSDKASQLLEAGNSRAALEWYTEAERLARAAEDGAALCGLLGDKAVAYNRLGNTRRAIETYQEAIALSRAHQDWVNLSRWNQNLGLIHLRQEAYDQARTHLKEALDAALASGVPYQISTAVGNYAVLLERLERYEEAIQAIDQAMDTMSDDPELKAIWRSSKFGIYDRWGTRLSQEGQLAAAVDAYASALQYADHEKVEELGRAAVLAAQMTALYEQQNDIPKALSTLDQATSLFQKLGDEEAVANLRSLRSELSGQRLNLQLVGDIAGYIATLQQTIAQAVADGDRHTEVTARVNLVTLLVQQDDPQAPAVFEETLAIVRRLQDRRRELILCLNVIPYFLQRDQVPRARDLAERAVSLAGHEQVEQKILANLYLGQVRVQGLDEPGYAMEAYRNAIVDLRRYSQSDSQAAQALLDHVQHLIAEAAQTALKIDSLDEAVEIMSLIDPDAGAELQQLRRKTQPAPVGVDLATLRAMSDPALDPALAAWRAKGADAQYMGASNQSPLLERMAGIAQVLEWTDAASRLAAAPTAEHSDGASRNGPAGLIHLAKMVVSHDITYNAAQDAVRAIALPDDDLAFVSLYVMQDNALSSSGVAFTVWRLAAACATGPVLAGRIYRLLGMSSSTDLESQLRYHLLGADRLSGGEDDALRALHLNEAAVSLTNLGRFEEALEMAGQAQQLAETVGATQLTAMATGNMGLSLMNLRRWEEAIAVLEPLAELQQTIGDEQGLANTRHNLNACYIATDREERVTLDEESADPDSLFNQAAYLGLRGEYERAIGLYNRAFQIIEAMDPPYLQEAEVRSTFARTLFDAGQREEAFEQMRRSAQLYEQWDDLEGLHDAYAWLAGASLNNRAVREYYAERALELSRQLNNPEALAVDLGHLGQVKAAEGQYDEAVTLLEEAAGLADQPDLRALLADAFVGAGRASEALSIYDELMTDAVQENDTGAQIRLLLGQAEARQELLQDREALTLLRQAHSLASGLGQDEIGVQAANRLGLALLGANILDEAAHVLENGIDQARALNLPDQELSLLNSLGSVLKEIGDLDGAERTLLQVRARSRDLGLAQSEVIALFTLGNVVATQGRREQALDHYKEAAYIAHEAGRRDIEAASLDSVGTTYVYLGKPERAIEYHKRAARLHQELGQWDRQATDLINLVQAYLALDETDQAAAVVAEAAGIATKHDIRRLAGSVAVAEGRIAAQTGDWERARQHFQTAIHELEMVRGTLRTPAQQRQWAADKAKVYYIAAEAASKAGDGGAALEFIEANKARFLHALIHRRTQRPASVDEATWLRYQQASDRRSELQARRWASLVASDSDVDQALREATVTYLQARAAVEAASAETMDSLPAAELSDWRNLAHAIPHGHVAVSLAVYSDGLGIAIAGQGKTGSLWTQAVMADTFTLADLDRLIFGDRAGLRQATIEGQIEQFPAEAVGWLLGAWTQGQSELWLDAMTRVMGPEVQAASQLWPKTIAAVCHVLGRRIWPAILKIIPTDTKKLILMPSAGLAVLPLHGALLTDGDCVDQHFDISYAPSLAILEQIQQHSPPAGQLRLAQAVNPSEDLPFSAIEANIVAHSLHDAEVTALIGSQAKVDSVLSLLATADIFHFSGHAFYDQLEPFRSGLRCATIHEEEKSLTLGFILDQLTTIPSRLVVLSACETGQVEANDFLNDFLGLPGGFIVAGANAVLASLWRVNDLATSLLLGKFFELWDGGRQEGPAALAAAQRWLRNATAEDLANLFAQERAEQGAENSIVYEQVADAWQRFTFDFEDDDKPYDEPMYWAAFTYTGV